MAQNLTEGDVERRLPLWTALAQLFLDTEMQAYHYQDIASAAREGAFSLQEVRQILDQEVVPAFAFNLLDIAGEWAMFSSDYVRDAMIESLRWPGIHGAGVAEVRRAIFREDWPKVEAALLP